MNVYDAGNKIIKKEVGIPHDIQIIQLKENKNKSNAKINRIGEKMYNQEIKKKIRMILGL